MRYFIIWFKLKGLLYDQPQNAQSFQELNLKNLKIFMFLKAPSIKEMMLYALLKNIRKEVQTLRVLIG